MHCRYRLLLVRDVVEGSIPHGEPVGFYSPKKHRQCGRKTLVPGTAWKRVLARLGMARANALRAKVSRGTDAGMCKVC
jgi:hypothetical protein